MGSYCLRGIEFLCEMMKNWGKHSGDGCTTL